MIRKSMTEWQGDGQSGSGSLSTESGALREQPYSFKTRFQDGEDGKTVTNPEELLGAAHAACFAMTMAFILSQAGHPPKRLKVTAAVDISKDGTGFSITSIALDLEAQAEGLPVELFHVLTQAAKVNCPVSKALSATPISLTARLI
ncbi:MAG TPA: OsmC family protein [Polyangia bacterium]|nr:OsmC family protein [Polyangia bacterium]